MSGNNLNIIKTIIAAVFLLPALIFSDELEDYYQSGLEAYQNGQYSLAIQEFESILDSDWESPQLYYNLGNSYYRSGIISGAVWAYEKCLLLKPGHKDAQYNLQLANLKVVDRVEIPEPPFYLKYYRQVKSSFSSRQWFVIASLILLVLSLAVAARKLFKLMWISKLEVLLISILILVALIGTNSVLDRLNIDEGIIYSYSVDAYSAPAEHSTKLFEVHEGLKTGVLNHSDGWVEIELLDGKTGWVPEKDIRLLD